MVKIITIEEAVNQHKEYLHAKLRGDIKSIITPWQTFNEETGGIEPGTVVVLASKSGGGKTAAAIQLEESLPKLNKTLPVETLFFSFEMVTRNIISRKIAKNLNVNTRYINQTYGQPSLTETHLQRIDKAYSYYKDQKVVYVEDLVSIPEMDKIISDYRKKLIAKYGGVDKFILYVAIDHSVLILKLPGQEERMMLTDLYLMLMKQKKIGYSIFLILSQANRQLDDKERLLDRRRQMPNKGDTFGGDALFQAADYFIFIMNPYKDGVPTWDCYSDGELTEGKLFFHILKQREGGECILRMKNELEFARIVDYSD